MPGQVVLLIASALIEKDGKYLILQRSENNLTNKEKWQLPEGKVRPGEDLLKTLRRELLEETSLMLTNAKLFGIHSNIMEEAHRRGKTTILVSQGEQDDLKRQAFSFASYLLVANEYAFFRYAQSGFYSQLWLYENYNLELGAPLSPRYREGANWRRDFLNGYVTVNPATLDAAIVITR